MPKLYPIVISKINAEVKLVCTLSFPSDLIVTYDRVLVKLLLYQGFIDCFSSYQEEGEIFNWQKFLIYYSICFSADWAIAS